MDVEDPHVAQQIVAAYARVLERHTEAATLPAPLSDLPYPRDQIQLAIRTCSRALATTGQLTGDVRDLLEGAYVGLADFIDDELAKLMREFNTAAADGRLAASTPAERLKSDSWRTLERTSALAGKIAQSIAADAELLRTDFDGFAPHKS
jgi:hypothetical protein